jgi:hypothetical protein
MKRKIIFVLFALSILALGIGYVLSNAHGFTLCGVSLFCADVMTKGTGLFYSMQALAFVFAILLFFPQAFSAWKKFAVWYVPLMYLYFVVYENEGFFSIPEESVYRSLSIVYVLISVFLIAMAARKGAK